MDLNGLFSDLEIWWWDIFLAIIALVEGWAISRVAKRGVTVNCAASSRCESNGAVPAV